MNTAVILSARKEKDSEVPYPLLPYDNDTCLMDRNLEILRAAGFTKILIVTGYRSELFDKYRAEDTVILFNKEYEFSGSMGSLAVCEGHIDSDFLLIEGDTFYEKKIIDRLVAVERGNCLSMTEESGSGDECFLETKNGFVTKITKDRHRVRNFEGELIGISRIALATFRHLMVAWKESTNPLLNYEYLLMDISDPLDRPCIHFRNLIWGAVSNRSDFKRLQNDLCRMLRRKENPYDQENLIGYLKAIFPDEDVSKAEIAQIGGMSNKNFKVTLDGKGYVLRVPGRGSEGMVERHNEEFNAQEAVKLGINPPIRYFNPENGVKLADFIEDAETLNAATVQRYNNMKKIAQIYRRVHNSHIRLRNEFNIFQEIEKYDRLIERSGAKMYEGWEELKPKVMALEGYLNMLGVDLKPCHNDALYNNFLQAPDGTIYLIDWEYSGMNDPMADFAALFIEAGFDPENQEYILEQYFDGPVSELAREKILCYQVLWDYLWAQWTVIKEARGDDFGSYGIDRFNRAAANITRISNS